MNITLHRLFIPSARRVTYVWLISSMLLIFSMKAYAEGGELTLTTNNSQNTYLFEESGQWYYGSKEDGSEKATFNGTITGNFDKALRVISTTGQAATLTIRDLTVKSTNYTKNLDIYEGTTLTINLTGKNEWQTQDNNGISIQNKGNLTVHNQGTFQLTGDILNTATGILKLTNKEGESLIILGSILGAIKNENPAEGSLTVPAMLDWIGNNLQGEKVKWIKQGFINEPVEFQMPANRSAIMTVVAPNENYTFFIEDKQVIANINGTDKYTSFFTASDGKMSHYTATNTTDEINKINSWPIYGATAKVMASDSKEATGADVIIQTNIKHLTVNTARGLAWIALLTNLAGSEIDGFKGCTIELAKDIDGSKTATGMSTTPNWIPIGNSKVTPFKANFNGTGKTVKGLEMMSNSIVAKTDADYYVGLFGCVNGSKIENLIVSNYCSFKNTEAAAKNIYLGAIAGYADNAIFSTCTNQKSLLCSGSDIATDQIWIGGIVGLLEGNSSVATCSNVITTTDKYNSVSATSDKSISSGGIAGEIAENSSVTNCFNSQTVKAVTSLKTGEIKLISHTGGIVGNSRGAVSNCYSTGAVSTFNTPLIADKIACGGVVGTNSGTIDNCYASGAITVGSNNTFENSNFFIGGIAAINSGKISNCIYFQKAPDNFLIKYKQGKASRISSNEAGGTLTNNYANACLVVSPERKAADKENGEDAFLLTVLSTVLTDGNVYEFADGKLPTLKAFGNEQAAYGIANNLAELDNWGDYAKLAHVDVNGSDVAITLTGDVATGFTVKTARGLAWIAWISGKTRIKDYSNPYFPEKQGFEGCTVELATDIDMATAPAAMTDKSWIPVGTNDSYSFKGLFDGKGYSVKGLQITNAGLTNVGLFGQITNATIRNTGVELSESSGITIARKGGCFGGIVGLMKGTSTVENCDVGGKGSITLTSNTGATMYVGGIAGDSQGTSVIKNCYSTVDISVTGEGGSNVGSIAGKSANEIINCVSVGELKGKSVGGITASGKVTRSLAANQKITTSADYCRVGSKGSEKEMSYASANMQVYKNEVLQEFDPYGDITKHGGNCYTQTSLFFLGDAWDISGDKMPRLKIINADGSYSAWPENSPQPADNLKTSDYMPEATNWMQLHGADVSSTDNKKADVWLETTANGDIYHVRTPLGLSWINYVVRRNLFRSYENNSLLPIKKGFEDCTVILDNDIDFTAGGMGKLDWLPIGYNGGEAMSGSTWVGNNDFKGIFDGNFHTVSNMKIEKLGDENCSVTNVYLGLFGYTRNGQIKNLTVQGAIKLNASSLPAKCGTIGSYVGGIAGSIGLNGSIVNCVSNVSIEITDDTRTYLAGGIAGSNGKDITESQPGHSLLENVYSTGAIQVAAKSIQAGGITASNKGTVLNCYSTSDVEATGTVTGYPTYAGGIVGFNSGKIKSNPAILPSIQNCFATGTITAMNNFINVAYAGGICGYNSNGTMKNCLALNRPKETTAAAVSSKKAGRIAGHVAGNETYDLKDNYSSTLITLQENGGTIATPKTDKKTTRKNGADVFVETIVDKINSWTGEGKAFTMIDISDNGILPQLRIKTGEGTYSNDLLSGQTKLNTADYLQFASKLPLELPDDGSTITLTYSDNVWKRKIEPDGEELPFNGTITSTAGTKVDNKLIVQTVASDAAELILKDAAIVPASGTALTVHSNCSFTLSTAGTGYLASKDASAIANEGTIKGGWVEWTLAGAVAGAVAGSEQPMQWKDADGVAGSYTLAIGEKSFATSLTGGKSYMLEIGETPVEQKGMDSAKNWVSSFTADAAQLTSYTDISELKTIIISERESYGTSHKGNHIHVAANAIFSVDASGASIFSLIIEPGGQVANQQPLKVIEDFVTTRPLNNKWSAFATPVSMAVTVAAADNETLSADDSQLFYTANGYLTTDADAQKWSNISGTEGTTSASFTAGIPYLIAAEKDLTEATFKATAVTIPAVQEMKLGEALANGVFLFVANNSLRKLTLSNIYVLNAEKNCFELTEGETIVEPMQAFIVANAVTQAAVRSLTLTGDNMPTANEQTVVNDGTRIYGADGQLCISLDSPADITVFNTAGQLVRSIRTTAGDTQIALPSGIYLVRCKTITYKIKL